MKKCLLIVPAIVFCSLIAQIAPSFMTPFLILFVASAAAAVSIPALITLANLLFDWLLNLPLARSLSPDTHRLLRQFLIIPGPQLNLRRIRQVRQAP